MPYGLKRGMKLPGEYQVTDIMGLALAGAVGIVAALVTDYQQSAEASAIYTLNRWAVSLGSILGFSDIPLWAVVIGLVSIGAMSIFYFQPLTRQAAFAQGFGLLTVITTAIPADLAAGIEEVVRSDNLPGLVAPAAEPPTEAAATEATFRPSDKAVNPHLQKAVFTGNGDSASPLFTTALDTVSPVATTTAAATVVQSNDGVAQYDVLLYLTFEGGLPGGDVNKLIRRGWLRGRLHNAKTKQTYNLFRNAGGQVRQVDDETLVIHAGVPARDREAELWVRIECNGHQIEEQSATATLGQELKWRITIKESSTPLFMQRLNRSYWF